MPESSKICASCLCGLATLGIAACASTETYDPEPKFSRFEAAPAPVELTGSRITQYGSQDELTRNALSPTSVITEEYINRYGESNLARLLCRHFPNMVGSRLNGNNQGRNRIGGSPC